MKRWIQIVIVAMAIATLTGCASTKAYCVDRGRDASDIITVTVGAGVGAKARIGPLDAGLLAEFPVIGLKCGKYFVLNHAVYKLPPSGEFQGILFEYEWFNWGTTLEDSNDPRNKNFIHIADIGEPLDLLINTPHTTDPSLSWRLNWSYQTQIEIVAAFGPSVRLGLNPGEFIDFILGWVGIDVFNDDLESRRRKKQSNNASLPIRSPQRAAQGRTRALEQKDNDEDA